MVSRQIRGTKIGDEIRSALASYTQRVIYANSVATDSTVLDAEPHGPAANEIYEITKELKEFAHGIERRQTKSKATT